MEERAKQAKYEAERAAEEYFLSGVARTALLTASVQPVKIYQVKRGWKNSFFGRKEVEYGDLIGRGWVLGEFEWEYLEHLPYGEGSFRNENCLTVLVESPDLLPRSPMDALAPVRPYSEGYALCLKAERPLDVGGKYSVFRGDWIAVAQAVKHLLGESS